MSQHQRERTAPTVPKHGDSSAARRSGLDRLLATLGGLALLFGGELDAELERGRQLQAGIVAERDLHLPPRDSRVTEKNQAKEERDVEQGRALRQSGGQHS
ncbi:MAG: rane protein [Mycobacterium sp.]|nr:rane protein [Mycobacterium sp.]